MKIKKFENISKYFNKDDRYLYAFEDENLQIEKISYGPNNGKIQIRFYDEKTNHYSYKCSMMAGCARLIDTEYENYPEIRKIELAPDYDEFKKFRKVQTNTIESILKYFLEKNGIINEFIRLSTIKYKEQIKNIAENAKDLGDILDELRKIYIQIKFDYDEWKMQNDANKYNL